MEGRLRVMMSLSEGECMHSPLSAAVIEKHVARVKGFDTEFLMEGKRKLSLRNQTCLILCNTRIP